MSLQTYLPQDRLRAVANREFIPDRAIGTALFADISGFTPLTEKLTRDLGARRGIENIAQRINNVYDELIKQVESFGGSVISFSGDAVTCWFDESLGESASNAVVCARSMQEVMKQFPNLSVKIAVCSGPVRRFVVGNPAIQLIDTLAGSTIARLATAEQLADAGEIILDQETAQRASLTDLPKRATKSGELFSTLDLSHNNIEHIQISHLDSSNTIPQIDENILKQWILPAVFEKEITGHELFLTELRPTAALFIRFTGIDYDDDPLAREKLNTIISKTQQVLDAHEGALLELTIGDKGSYIYASFGATRVHENDAQRAIRAALDIRAQLGKEGFLELLQIGLSSGTMRVGGYGGKTRKSFSALGNSVNLAARLMMAARPGEILISSRIQKSNKGEFAVDARPPLIIKGWPEPILVFAVIGEVQQRAIRLREPSYQLPMIGREKELKLIADGLELAISGRGQVIGITGEAGLGKSRLIAEGIRLSQRKKFVGYGGACQSDGINIPYAVWNPIWNAIFDLDPAMPLRKQVRTLEGELEDRVTEHTDALPVLGAVLGLPLPDNDFTKSLQPADRKAQLETVLLKFLASVAQEAAEDGGGLLFVLEDLQWVDPISLDLLLLAAREIENLPVLVLLTYRPVDIETHHASIHQLTSLNNFVQINLTELNANESEQAIRAKLAHLFPEQRDSIPHILIERITNRAQGNPFYVEELLNYMHDRGIDLRDITILNNLELPTSLHSLVLSRIDYLTSSQQLTLKAASIIGRVFQFEHLHKYYPRLGAVEMVKSDLQVMDRLDLTPLEPAEPELTYLFKHLVTHEVGYESIAYATRAKLHGQYALYLENAYPDKVEQLAAQLAYHYEKAGIQQKAQYYLIKSGRQAAANYANEDALSYFNRALKLAPDEHARVYFDTLMQRERVYDLLGRRTEQKQDLDVLARLASGFEDSLLLRSQVTIRQAKLKIDEGDYSAAKQSAKAAIEELSAESQKQRDLSELLVDALLLEARAMFLAGQAVAARPQLESALSLARTHHYIRGEYNALAQLGLWNWYDGDNKSAIEFLERSLDLIREAGDIRRESDILNNLGIVAKDMYRFNDSLAYYEMAHKIIRKIGDRYSEAGLLNNMGRASIMSGDLVRAISYCNQAAILARETNDPTVQGLALHNKSEAYKELGQFVLARDDAEKSIKLLQSSGYQAGEAWALENLAMIEFMLGKHSKALELVEQALAISRAIASRRLEVSVLTRLGLMQLEANQLELAEEAFKSAQKTEEEFKESIPMFEIQAGLAGVALARGDVQSTEKARALIQGLAGEILQEPPAEQSHFLPLWLYAMCIRVMKTSQDPEVEKMIRRANNELRARSDKISDDTIRAGFMNAPESRSIPATPDG